MILAQNETLIKEINLSESLVAATGEIITDKMILTDKRLVLESKTRRSFFRDELPIGSILGMSASYQKASRVPFMKIILIILSILSFGYFGYVIYSGTPLLLHPLIFAVSGFVLESIAGGLGLIFLVIALLIKRKKDSYFEFSFAHTPISHLEVNHQGVNKGVIQKHVIKVAKEGYKLVEEIGALILDLQNGVKITPSNKK